MKKIFTIRDFNTQREFMWHERKIDEEVRICSKRHLKKNLFEYLPKNDPILEAGCGLGAWLIYLSERGYNISGIDNDLKVVRRLMAKKTSLKVSYGDVRKLPHADNTFGALLSLGVIEHFENGCEDALREAYRVIKPGGIFVLTVPMNNIFRKIIAHPIRSLYLKWHIKRGKPNYFAEYRFSKNEVESMLVSFGFRPILTTYDDFVDRTMSLGIWSDFPPLQANSHYEMIPAGKFVAFLLNSFSRWIASSGILCIASKPFDY